MAATSTFVPPDLGQWELIGRLALSLGLGAAIGIEREWRDRTAGLRTHILVCLGSAAFTIVSAYGFSEWYQNAAHAGRAIDVSGATRIAAQVVSGIGFLGAGAILRSDDGIRGLTTAASLWVMAAIGMACGAGYYELAVASTLLILIVLVALRQVSGRIKAMNRGEQTPLDVIVAGPDAIGLVLDVVARMEGRVSNFAAAALERELPSRRLTFDVSVPAEESVADLVGRLASLEGVDSVSARDMPPPSGL
jgi:putative Mg2+ transporter-C (MgtC) family protein